MKSDIKIKQDILDELAWQPNISETEIGVIVENGVVMLTGVVSDYSKKIAAEKAAKSIKGVKALAEDIEVKYEDDFKKTDKEIAKAVLHAIAWNPEVPSDKISIEVDHGKVTLSGEVDWAYQRNAARESVEKILGVTQVFNNTCLKQTLTLVEVKSKIKKAFERLADLDAGRIDISTDGYTITLSGQVGSIKEKETAEAAAYRAPGVYQVNNELKVHAHPDD